MHQEQTTKNFEQNLYKFESTQQQDLETRILSSENLDAAIPTMAFAAAAEYSRDGQDLVMQVGDNTVVVKNYFAHANYPVLKTMDGGVIPPQIVKAFFNEQQGNEYYASSLLERLLDSKTNALDDDAIAIVESLQGTVLVIRNGKAITLQRGDIFLTGDQVSTSEDGKLEIIFADGTQFQLGAQARVSLDEFSYDAANSVGLQIISILRGAFSYASGLVAKNDPSNVQLRTPIGEIGIRGTKVVGEVDADSATASVTVLEGRVIYENLAGEQFELNQGFETLQISNGGNTIKETTLSPERVAKNYDIFDSIVDISNFVQQPEAGIQNDGTFNNNQRPSLPSEIGAGIEDSFLQLPPIPIAEAIKDARALAIASIEFNLDSNDDIEALGEAVLSEIAQLQAGRIIQRSATIKYQLGDDSALGADDLLSAGKIILVSNSHDDTIGANGATFGIELNKLNGKVQVIIEHGDFGNGLFFTGAENIRINFIRGAFDVANKAFDYPNGRDTFNFNDDQLVASDIGIGVISEFGPDASIKNDILMEINSVNRYTQQDQVFHIILHDYYPNGQAGEGAYPNSYSITSDARGVGEFTYTETS